MVIKGANKRWKTKSTIVHNRLFCTRTLHELRSLNVSIVLLTWLRPKSEKSYTKGFCWISSPLGSINYAIT